MLEGHGHAITVHEHFGSIGVSLLGNLSGAIQSEVMFLQRVLTKVPHMATTAGDEETVQYMLKRWQDAETGLDQAWREEYLVYLSFPDPKNPNKVSVGKSAGR